MSICGNMIGGTAPIKTLTFVDPDGNEFTGVVTGSEVVFTATDNDVREGSVYAGDDGVSTGTKVIPSYHTTEGYQFVPAGSEIKITGITNYEYTKLQVLVCAFNSSIAQSVATEKVSIDGNVYAVNSADVLAAVTLDVDNKAINLGLTNDGENPVLIRYFTYKEMY